MDTSPVPSRKGITTTYLLTYNYIIKTNDQNIIFYFIFILCCTYIIIIITSLCILYGIFKIIFTSI